LKKGSLYYHSISINATIFLEMRSVTTNHLTAFATPDRANIFRIVFSSESPDITLEKLCSESPVSIVIHLTKEVEVTQRFLSGWSGILKKFEPLRPGSKWLLMESREVQCIFDATHPIIEPPPFLEHMPTDECRSRSVEPECKEPQDTESEEDVEEPPSGTKLPPGAKWHKPTARGYSRNLWECFSDGTLIWHARPQFACNLCDSHVPHPSGWYGRYNAAIDFIIGEADGKKYATIGAFVNAHYELHGCEKQNGWATCKYFINGEWKDVGTIKPSQ
jgi:hypothetical protein